MSDQGVYLFWSLVLWLFFIVGLVITLDRNNQKHLIENAPTFEEYCGFEKPSLGSKVRVGESEGVIVNIHEKDVPWRKHETAFRLAIAGVDSGWHRCRSFRSMEETN